MHYINFILKFLYFQLAENTDEIIVCLKNNNRESNIINLKGIVCNHQDQNALLTQIVKQARSNEKHHDIAYLMHIVEENKIHI